jgi:hypothetical protein
MLTFPHTLVAALLVKIIPSPFISLPLAFASHFFLDFFIVHWNPHLYTEYKRLGKITQSSLVVILVDGLLALGICLYIVFKSWPNLTTILIYAAAIFLATLPDTIEIPYYFLHSKNKLLKKYIDFEHKHQSNGSFFWGMLTQILLVVFCLFLFLR